MTEQQKVDQNQEGKIEQGAEQTSNEPAKKKKIIKKQVEGEVIKVDDNPDNLMYRRPSFIYMSVGIFLIFVILILIYKLFFVRRIDIEKPVGYIWNLKFKAGLWAYLKQKQFDQFLVIHSPRGFGKTRAIRVVASELIEAGRTPFIFDFQLISKTASLENIRKIVQSQLLQSLIKIDGRGDEIPVAKVTQLLTPLTVLKETVPKTIHYQFKDQNLQKVAALLLQIAHGFESDAKTTLSNLFEAIDALSMLKPVVFVISPEKFIQNENKNISELYKSILQELRTYSESYKTTPTVCEISDQTLMQEVLQIPTCRSLYLGELSFEEVQGISKEKGITINDLKKIHTKYGGYGAAFALIRDNFKDGIPMQQTMYDIDGKDREWLSNVVYSANNTKAVLSFLKDAAKRDQSYNSKSEECQYLVKSGILAITADNSHVTFQTKNLKAAFEGMNFQ